MTRKHSSRNYTSSSSLECWHRQLRPIDTKFCPTTCVSLHKSSASLRPVFSCPVWVSLLYWLSNMQLFASVSVKLDSSHSFLLFFFQPYTNSHMFFSHVLFFTMEITMSQCERPTPLHAHRLSLALGSLVWYSISGPPLCLKQAFPVCQPQSIATKGNEDPENKNSKKHNVDYREWMHLIAFSCVREL